MFSTAARAAPEWTIPGIPLCGERVTLSTLPSFCGMNAFVAAACVISQVPTTLSSITVRKPFGEIASAGLRNWPPALLTSTSTRPWRSRTPSNRASTAASSRMSIATASALPASASASATIDSIGSGRRPQATTVAPRRTSSSADWRPSPVPAPETTQTRPSSSPGAKMRELCCAIAGAGYTATVRPAMKRQG